MQGQAPLWDAVANYKARGTCRMHMPGHKGTLPLDAGFDITELPESDNLYRPNGPIMRAQQLAALSCGAKQTFFVTNGGSAGVMAMLLSAADPGETVLLPRDCHSSALHGCIVGGLEPRPILPAMSADGSVAIGLTPEAAEEAFIRFPQARAVLVTRPNYYGLCCDLPGIVRVAHRYGARVLVDEAHGAHFPYAPHVLPKSASACGADAWVQSPHKTLPALGQSALLHLSDISLAARAARVLRLLSSSSPSYLMMAQLDAARRDMATRGEERLEALVRHCAWVRDALEGLMGLSCARTQWRGAAGLKAIDATRLVFDVRTWGGGAAVAARLDRIGLVCEMHDAARVVCIPTVCDEADDFARLVDAFRAAAPPRLLRTEAPPSYPMEIGQAAVSPRTAFFSPRVMRPLEHCTGAIAADCAGLYPPGIPSLWPGERIGAGVVRRLSDAPEHERFGVDNNHLAVLA